MTFVDVRFGRSVENKNIITKRIPLLRVEETILELNRHLVLFFRISKQNEIYDDEMKKRSFFFQLKRREGNHCF